ncbi:MAG: hypothetical protein IKM02_02040 [Clostridia bacterium]|nr:hypothetical protein [Clostridia bacterium]
MNTETLSRMNTYLDEQIARCKEKEKALLSDGRSDEADFEKVRANIFDVFRTVLSAGTKACSGDLSRAKQFFEEKTVQIPSNWETAYEKAKQHNDTARMHIEQIKLDAVREIRETFSMLGEES